MRVKVDFNRLVRGGQVRASLRHVEGDLQPGDMVTAYDPSEDLIVEATVMEVDLERKRVYLLPHWDAADEIDLPTARVRLVAVGVGLQTLNGTTSAVRLPKYHTHAASTSVTEGVLVSV